MHPAWIAFFVVSLVAAACGEAPSPDEARPQSTASTPEDGPRLYEAMSTVLESSEHGPELCLGGVLDSLPPQCGGVPLDGWDWGDVSGEERRGSTIWGDFHVIGTYDGKRLTVTDAGPPERSDEAEESIDTPCTEPAGGWYAPDPSRATQEDVSRAARFARRQPGFAGVWVDYYGPRDPDAASDAEAYGDIILNVAFTRDLERHEEALREVWGGALCVTELEHTHRELRAIQRDLTEKAADEFGLELLWSSTDEVRGQVEVGVVTIDPATQAALDERYGAGIVQVIARLRPVE